MNFLLIAFFVLLLIALFGNKNETQNNNENTGHTDTQRTVHPAEMQLR